MNRKTGVLMSYVAMIFEVLSTLLLTPYMLRTLGQAEYGVYKLAAAIVSYLLLLDLGVGNSVIRYIAKFKANKEYEQCRKFLGVATIYYTAIAIVTVVIGVVLIFAFPSVFAEGLSAEEVILGQKLLGVAVANAAVMLGTAAYANTVVAYQYFSFQKGCLIIQIVVKIILTYLGLKLGFGSISIVVVQLLTTLMCRFAYVLFVLFKIKLLPLFRGLDSTFIKEVFVYSSLILLQMIATQINACADQILLGAFVASSSIIIGVYGVGSQIVTYFQSIGNSMTGVLMPGIVALIESKPPKERITNEMIRISRIVLSILIIIWIGFIVFGKQFIILWAGRENEQAYVVAVILMFAHMLILTEAIGTQVLWAMNQHKEQAILKLCIVIVNVILTIALIKWNALIGATIGTFISLMLGDVFVMNVIFVKKIGISIKRYYSGLVKGILPAALLTGIIGFLVRQIGLQGWIGFFINVMVMTASYVALIFLFGFNQYEKGLVNAIVRKLLKR